MLSVALSIDCDNSGRISTRYYFQFVQKDFWGSAHRYDTRTSRDHDFPSEEATHIIISYIAVVVVVVAVVVDAVAPVGDGLLIVE